MKLIKSDKLRFVLKIVISAILLVVVFNIIDLKEAYKEIVNADLFFISLSILFLYVPVIFKAIRWKYIIQLFKKDISFRDSFLYTVISMAFANITPARVGEFIKAKFLADKTNLSYLKSVLTILIDKLFDLMIVVLLAFWGFSFLDNVFIWSIYAKYFFMLYLMILGLIFLFTKKTYSYSRFLIPRKHKEDFEKLDINRTFYLKSMLLSLFTWALFSLQVYFTLLAININTTFFIVTGLVPLMALSSMIPITIGGIGIREIVAIYFLQIVGITPEKSTVFSLLFALINVFIPVVVGAIFNIRKKNIS